MEDNRRGIYCKLPFPNTDKHCVFVMVWGIISFHVVGNLAVIDGNVNADTYIEILEENLLESVKNMYGEPGYPAISQ